MRQPDYKMIQGGNIQVPMNPQLAGASGRGLARLGSTLAGVGVEASAILQKVKKADEDGKLIDAEEEWENSYAEYQKKMAITRNSPLEWQTGWEKNSQKLRHSIDNMEGSKEFKNNLRLRFTRWDGNVNRSIGRSATNTSFSNTANSYAAKYDRAQSQNNTELMLQTAQEATTLGYWPESRLYEAETAAKKLSITNEQTHGMQTDAFETFEEIETNKWGEDKYTHQRKVAKYRPALNAARRQIVDDAVNGVISGGISTPEDLEKEEYENLLPVQKEKIATFMKKFHDQKHKEWVASPEQQAIISSKVQDGIYNFQPNGEDSDMGYADVKMWINQLNPSAYKDEMQKALDSKQDGKMAEIKTIKDWGKAQINRNRKNALDRVAKPKVVKKTLFDYLEDGFLRNEQNLKDLGFSKGDVKNIMNAKVDRGANIKGDDARSTYSVQLGMFRDVYQSREDLSAGSDFQREMARTMMTGNLNTVLRESDDPATLLQFDEEQDRIHKMYGDLESEYNNHIKTHPKADKENVEEWLKDNNLYIESTIERNPVINPRPGTETSSVSDKANFGGSPGWFGGNTKQEVEQNLVEIQSPSGAPFRVNKAVAGNFESFLQELEGVVGYPINAQSSGGYHWRNKRGKSSLSQHSYGNAIDINWDENRAFWGGQDAISKIANIDEIAARHGLVWGGSWKNKDTMQFEYHPSTGVPARGV